MKILAHISWFFATIIILFALTLMIVLFHIVPQPYASKISSWIIRLSTFFHVDIKGEEDPEAQMFLVNHQSDLDIAVMETISSRDLAWVAKKELFDVPFFGLALRLPKNIAVHRESKTALVKLLKDAKKKIEQNKVITMFPEGTRSTKSKMLPFKSGAKIVADKYHLKVQPVVLIQTSKYYNIKKFHYQPGIIKAIFLDAFVADEHDENWLKDLRKKMQKVYDNELANDSSNR